MSSSQSILYCRYGYDPLDRLISQHQSNAPVHQRFYCKSRLTTEIQGATGCSFFQYSELLLGQQQRQDDGVDSTLLTTDQQRSVLHILKTNNKRQSIAYSPFGHHSAESGLNSQLNFNGERRESVTGHYLLGNGYRAFNPVLMRFNSPDNLSPFDKGGLNSYAYCLGDPINNSDPTGNVILQSRLKFFASVWIDRTLDSTSISFARSVGSSTQTIAPPSINSSNFPASLTPSTHSPLKTGASKVSSLTDLTLNLITNKKSRPILDQAPPHYRRRIDNLDNIRGKQVAAKLSENEPNNRIFRLAATGQLSGGIDWAENLPIQSKMHASVMKTLLHFTNRNNSPTATFRSFRLRRFDNARALISRQDNLNLRGR